jgi:LysR family glycine cleavage system transcriptional activator
VLLTQRPIHIMGYEKHWLTVRQVQGLGSIPASAGPTVDTTIAALELAAAGAGVALAHDIFLGAHFATGRLVKVLEREFDDDNSYYVITPERPQRIRREVQLFRDWWWLLRPEARARRSIANGSENRSRYRRFINFNCGK